MSKAATAAKPAPATTQARPAPQQQIVGQALATQAPGKAPAVRGDVKSVLFDMAERYGMEPAAFEATLRNTVVPSNCSREQFAAFLLVAKEYRLNPLLKEIYAFPTKGGGIQPIVGIDGWANLVNSHPAFDGMEFEDRLDNGGNLISVTCRMFRKDRSRATATTEYLVECKRNTDTWSKWPRRMLRHKAMIQAARYAFGFAGIVDPDEAERFAAETARDVTPRRIASTAAAFDEFGRGAEIDAIAEAGELIDTPKDDEIGGEFADEASQQSEGQQSVGEQQEDGEAEQQAKPEEKTTGKPEEKAAATWPEGQEPKTPEEYQQYAIARLAAETEASAIGTWFKSKEQRDLRNAAGVTKDTFDEVKRVATDRVAELKAWSC